MASILLTAVIVNDWHPGKSSDSARSASLSLVTNENYAFSQAETECLNRAKRSFAHPNALYVDHRSTQDRGDGQYRVFLKVDASVAMGSESIMTCEAEIQSGHMRVTRMKEIENKKSDNKGIQTLLDALKMED